MASERILLVLILRVFGLYLLAQPVTILPYQVVSDVRNFIRHVELVDTWADIPANLIAPLIEGAVGAWLLLRARSIADYIAPNRAGVLCRCGYDLNGSKSNRCPECGVTIVNPGSVDPACHSLDNPDGLAYWLPRLIPILIAVLLCIVLLKDLAERFNQQAASCGC